MTKTTLMRLDGREFDKLAARTKLGVNACEMARQHLVEGLSMQAVGEKHGTSRQRVALAVGSIRRVYEEDGASVGANAWVTLSIELPIRLAEQLSAAVEDLKKSKSKQAKAAAIASLEEGVVKAREAFSTDKQ